MSLDIDPAVPLRRPNELLKLVQAIHAAQPQDEQDWLEWKGQLDLGDPKGRFALARAVLAMANRDPGHAKSFMQGAGYVVVGVEPGTTHGITVHDTAKLDDGLSIYVGEDGPRWSAQWVTHGAENVLVVIVEPPSPGDPIHALRKTYQGDSGKGADDGTIFVRAGTKSRRAKSADIAMLNSRRSASVQPHTGPPVSVKLICQPLPVINESAVMRGLEEVIDSVGGLAVAEGLARKPSQPGPSFLSNQRLVNIAHNVPNQSWSDYLNEVEDWKRGASSAAWRNFLDCMVRSDLGKVSLSVANDSQRNLSQVQVVFILEPPEQYLVYDDLGPDSVESSPPPRFRMQPKLSIGSLGSLRLPTSFPAVGHAGIRRSDVQRDENSIRLTFEAGDLRPGQILVSEAAYVLLRNHVTAAGEVRMSWRATCTDLDGVRSDVAAVPVHEFNDIGWIKSATESWLSD